MNVFFKHQYNFNVFIIVFFFASLGSFLFLFPHSAYSSETSDTYKMGLERLNDGDKAGAILIWKELADAGDMNSQYSVGILYEQQGETLSHKNAIKYLKLASKQGMHKAQFHLAMKYFSGYGVGQDFNVTIQLLLKAAAQDYPEAQYQLGRMSSDGLGFKQDQTEAIRWYMLAAENGFGPAQHTLASHYMTGNGTAVNVDKAVFWLKHASEQNHMLAQRDLGYLYTQGMGVDKDYAEAARLLKNPAQQGSPVSQYLLGQIYAEGGYGLDPSIRSAREWFTAALKSGYPKAEGALQQIANIPSEPLPQEEEAVVQEEEVVEDNSEVIETAEIAELADLVDPESEVSEQQFYDFYNEDLSAYRTSSHGKKNNNITSVGDWEFNTDSVIEVDEATLVEYDDIDGRFEEAFSVKAKSMGGRGNFKRLFGLSQDERDYDVRRERSYSPKVLNISKLNDDSNSKAVVYRGYTQSGEAKQLGFFTKESKQEKTVQESQEDPVGTEKKSNVSSNPVKQQKNLYSRVKTKSPNVKKNETDLTRFGRLSGDNFTLQILQSTNPAKIKKISRNNTGNSDGNLYILSANKNNRPIYLVTYGAYPDRKKAEAAAESLPGFVALGSPWVRKISKVQQQVQSL